MNIFSVVYLTLLKGIFIMFDIIIIQGSNQFPWKDVLISVGVPLIVAFMSWWGNRSAVKINRETLENAKYATPPELLRLEKWSTIVKDLEKYPESLKNGLDLGIISTTYNDVLKWATLENRIMNLGISSPEIRQALLQIKPGDGDGTYPKQSWKIFKDKIDVIMAVITIFSAGVSVYLIACIVIGFMNLREEIFRGWIISIFNIIIILVVMIIPLYILLLPFYLIWKVYIKKDDPQFYENNIIFRNAYHALKDIYLKDDKIHLMETPDEEDQRAHFKGMKIYKEWENRIKKKHFDWGTWNYGLNIGENNNPEFTKSESEGPTDLASSESIPDDPERKEP